VVSDITGVSAVAMLQALLAGQTDREALAELAKGRLRSKQELLQKALAGVLRAHHRLIIAQLLADIEFFEEQIGEVGAEIARRLEDHRQDLDRLDGIPGVNQRIGFDHPRRSRRGHEPLPQRAPSHLLGRALSGQPPERRQAAQQPHPARQPGAQERCSPTHRPPRFPSSSSLVEAAHAAGRTRGTYLQAQYKRLAAKRGKKRAKIAVARSILFGIYHMFKRAIPGARSEPTTSTSATRSKWSSASPNVSNPSATMSL
jgi:hypothetical protein